MKVGDKVNFTLKHKRELCQTSLYNAHHRNNLIDFGHVIGIVVSIEVGYVSKRLLANVCWDHNIIRSHYVDNLKVVK